MAVYDLFAKIYQRGPYLRFADTLGQTVFPSILEEWQIRPEKLLDIACGEGTFAIHMAKRGIHVTGLDQSAQMLALARNHALEESTAVDWVQGDMTRLNLPENEFDVVTCFFDSLNYLLRIFDLEGAFAGVYKVLKPGGWFIFDMNTVYGLAVEWMRQRVTIHNESSDFIEIHENDFDYENQIASIRIIVFEKHGDQWQRFEETHQERGYAAADIQLLLETVGLKTMAYYGKIATREPLMSDSGRVWFICRKPI